MRERTDREGGVKLQERWGPGPGAGDQAQAPNRCELLASRALVVSVAERGDLIRQVRSGETSASERYLPSDDFDLGNDILRWLISELFGAERRGVDERRLAGHHLGEQAPADRAERQAEMVVGEVEP